MPGRSASAPQSRRQRANKRRRHADVGSGSNLHNNQSSSPNGSGDAEEIGTKAPKRACNECRQQKVSFRCGWTFEWHFNNWSSPEGTRVLII